jgi:hypothetical protein
MLSSIVSTHGNVRYLYFRGNFGDTRRSQVRAVFEGVLDRLASAQVVESMDSWYRVVRKVHFASTACVDCAIALVVVTGYEFRIRLIRLLR